MGADIPLMRVMTVEVRYNWFDQALHDLHYWPLIKILNKGPEDDDEPGKVVSLGARNLASVGLCPSSFSRACRYQTLTPDPFVPYEASLIPWLTGFDKSEGVVHDLS